MCVVFGNILLSWHCPPPEQDWANRLTAVKAGIQYTPSEFAILFWQMSALGRKQTLRVARAMSALPPKADMCGAARDVCFGPRADIRGGEKKDRRAQAV